MIARKSHHAKSIKMTNCDILVVGSCNIDLVNYINRQPLPGETMTGISFEYGFGGKGANQAVMARLLGAKVCMVGKVGRDVFGSNYMKHFQDLDVVCDSVSVCDEGVSTGTATILVSKEGENSIILTPGANKEVTCEFISSILPPLLSQAKIVMVQNEIDPAATLLTLKMAHRANVCTIFNTAPVSNEITPEFYKYSTILCSNEVEISQLSKQPCTNSLEDLGSAAEVLMKQGCEHIIVTLGSQGAAYFSPNNKKGTKFNIPLIIDSVVDTTGSGDAFLAALAFHILPSLNLSFEGISQAIKKALIVASVTVTAKGAQSGYTKTIDKIKKMLKDNALTIL